MSEPIRSMTAFLRRYLPRYYAEKVRKEEEERLNSKIIERKS